MKAMARGAAAFVLLICAAVSHAQVPRFDHVFIVLRKIKTLAA